MQVVKPKELVVRYCKCDKLMQLTFDIVCLTAAISSRTLSCSSSLESASSSTPLSTSSWMLSPSYGNGSCSSSTSPTSLLSPSSLASREGVPHHWFRKELETQ